MAVWILDLSRPKGKSHRSFADDKLDRILDLPVVAARTWMA